MEADKAKCSDKYASYGLTLEMILEVDLVLR